MKKAYVIVDAYSSGRMLPDIFREKICDNQDAVLVHVQSTPYIMSKMAVFEVEKYAENIIYTGIIDNVISALSKYHVLAVLVGQEPGVELADLLSEKLNLSSNGTRKSTARRDKYEMIKTIADAGLAAPKFIKSKKISEILHWIEAETNYPVVLKVLRSASTDGVYICRDEQEVSEAFAKSIGHKTIMEEINSEVLVESFLNGKEYVVDAVSYDGQHYITDVWLYEKRYIPGHGNIYDKETLLSSDLPEVEQLIEYSKKMLDALEIKYGPTHAEIMLTPEQGPVLVEVGARLNGVVHPKLHDYCLGHNQAHLTVDCYADAKRFFDVVSTFPYKKKNEAMIVNLINDNVGVIDGIDEDIVSKIRALPSVVDIVIKVKPGQYLEKTRNLLQSPIRIFMGHEFEKQIKEDYAEIQTLKESIFNLS
jgi:biotin carboxylase